jgi:two-component system LytT family sensor kinase
MMRHTMSVSKKTVITLAEDLDQMEQYLRIEQLRFQFRYCIDISPKLNLNTIDLPPQLLQPSLENAVKHGASGLREEGEVHLKIYAENDDLHIRIVNNNKAGFRRPDKGQGQGLKFTYEQIGYLRQLFTERHIDFDLQVTEEGAVTTFFFEDWLKPE